MRPFKRIRALVALVACLASADTTAEQGLTNCADQFPGSSVSNAPKVTSTGSSGNIHLCSRSGDVSFFALEYRPARYAPLWVSYRIADSFGTGGCASMTRKRMQCHFKVENVDACIADKKAAPGDPFHMDLTLTEKSIKRLGTGDFSGTGHDRGHMAPNNAFSWHACGAYKTFTMANMGAQWATLNRALWANLEAQMLYWGARDAPIVVTVGPIWRKFPSEKFQTIQNGTVKTDSFPKPGDRLVKTNGEATSKTIPRPTGFYMIAFRPGANGEPERTIGFLVPHTKQEGLSFWNFVSTVKLVEETSGLDFGFADQLKGWPDLAFWRDPQRKIPSGWDIRDGCTEQLPVAAWIADRALSERLLLCESSSPTN